MKYTLNTSRLGMLIALGVTLTALWLVAAFGFYQESERAKYDVHIQPGVVSYGTLSSAVVPLTPSSMHRSVAPMISGNTVRSMARGGHASLPQAVATGEIRTTSIGTAKAFAVAVNTSSGGGGTASGGASSKAVSRASGASGASYSIGAVPMPTMAMVSRSYATEVSVMGESTTADESLSGKTSLGGKKDGSDNSNPGTPGNPGGGTPMIPVGATPWLLMLLLTAGYGLFRTIYRKA